MRLLVFTIAIFMAFTRISVADSETSVTSAYKMCFVFDNSSMLSEPCEVSGWHSSVDIRLDMPPSEARDFCTRIPELIESLGNGIKFDIGWKLRMYSPFSGDNTIAQCKLY